MTDDVPAIQFTEVERRFDTRGHDPTLALEGINLEVRPREIMALLGPSGCGKTTLLRLAAGLDRPTAGRVLSFGVEVTGPSRDRGLIFQAYNVFPFMTVAANVAFGLRDREAPGEITFRVIRLLRETGLVEYADRFPKALSGGMQQRLAVARALAVRPRLLLADEPFGALDEPTRCEMRKLLAVSADSTGCAVVLVTHDVREALLISDRIILLSARPGRIIGEWRRPESAGDGKAVEGQPWFAQTYDEIVRAFPVQLTGEGDI